MQMLLSLSLALFAGLMLSRLAKIVKLPAVTAYLVAGILVGPFCLGALKVPGLGFHSLHQVEGFSILTQVALGFIAFAMGNEFRLAQLKAMGSKAIVIGIFQAVVTTVVVDIVLIALHLLFPNIITLPAAITLGAIASATAPAATLMVVKQYKADGPLTRLLLLVVALDDAVGLIVFAVSFGIARSLMEGAVDMVSILVNPIVEIVCSLGLGAIMGWILTQLEKMFNSNTNRLNMSTAFVFLTVALSMIDFHIGAVHISFSSLLVCMMLGTIFCNICPLSEDLMERTDKWTSPLFALFFVISGAELELNVFAEISIVLIGLVYILFRSLGKYFGTMMSAKMTACSPAICKYLGITLLPQAGVALGMCAIAAEQLPGQGNLIRNITLFAVLVYEIFGPVFTRWALTKAGDIQPMSEEVKNRRKTKLAAAQKAE